MGLRLMIVNYLLNCLLEHYMIGVVFNSDSVLEWLSTETLERPSIRWIHFSESKDLNVH